MYYEYVIEIFEISNMNEDLRLKNYDSNTVFIFHYRNILLLFLLSSFMLKN